MNLPSFNSEHYVHAVILFKFAKTTARNIDEIKIKVYTFEEMISHCRIIFGLNTFWESSLDFFIREIGNEDELRRDSSINIWLKNSENKLIIFPLVMQPKPNEHGTMALYYSSHEIIKTLKNDFGIDSFYIEGNIINFSEDPLEMTNYDKS